MRDIFFFITNKCSTNFALKFNKIYILRLDAFSLVSKTFERSHSEAAISPPGSGNAETQCEGHDFTSAQCQALGCCNFEEGQVSFLWKVWTFMLAGQVFALVLTKKSSYTRVDKPSSYTRVDKTCL